MLLLLRSSTTPNTITKKAPWSEGARNARTMFNVVSQFTICPRLHDPHP